METVPKPGCLLLDARLPGMSGVEFQEQMRNAGIGIPVIFMTAHGDMPMVRKVMKTGAVEFLIKPFQKEELLHAVEQAFALDRERRKEREIVESIRARIDSLSPREREVMAMVTAGLLNKQIAARTEPERDHGQTASPPRDGEDAGRFACRPGKALRANQTHRLARR